MENAELSCIGKESSSSQLSSGSVDTDHSLYSMEDRSTKHRQFVCLNAPRNLINDSNFTGVLDCLKLSDNAATMLISSIIKACEGDPKDFCLSRSSTHRARIANRLKVSQDIFEKFVENLPKHIALHWDGKLTKDRLGNRHDALSVVASGEPSYISGFLLVFVCF